MGGFDPWVDDPWTYDRARPVAVRSLREAVGAFVRFKREAGRGERTLKSYRDLLGRFARHAGPAMPVAQLTGAHVSRYVASGDVRASTRQSRYRHVATFVRWAVKEGLIVGDPLSNTEPPPVARKLPKHVTRGELDAVCAAVLARSKEVRRAGEVAWYAPLFRFTFYTGLRLSEVGRLRWGDVDIARSRLSLHVQKNRREQTVPLARAALAALEEVPRGEAEAFVFRSPKGHPSVRSHASFCTTVSKAFLRFRRAAGIERPVTFHGLRHGFCTALAEAGKSAVVLREAARHASVTTSMLYVHFASEALRDDLDDVFS